MLGHIGNGQYLAQMLHVFGRNIVSDPSYRRANTLER